MNKQLIKKNYTIKELEFITGMTLWNYSGICKAMMIRKLKNNNNSKKGKHESIK